MPIHKDFKRLVRARMQKTGEAYTAARASLLKNRAGGAAEERLAAASSSAVPAAADFARLAGMSDEALKAKTGCTWERWVGALDYVKAYQWPHREIAEYVQEKYQVKE